MKTFAATVCLTLACALASTPASAQSSAIGAGEGKLEQAKRYFSQIDAVRHDSRRAFMRPKEVRYAFGAAGRSVDVLVLTAKPETPAIVARTMESSVTLSRIAFAGNGCWSARYYIEASPDTFDAIEQARLDPSRIVRVVPGGTDGLFPELDRACGGSYCSYNVPTEEKPGRYLSDEGPGTTEDGTTFCIDPQVLSESMGRRTGIPTVLSTSSDIPCAERRKQGVTDDVCQAEEDLVSYSFDWETVERSISSSAPLHCDHKQQSNSANSVCDMLNVAPDERLGRVTQIGVRTESGLQKLTGQIEFRDEEIARKVFDLIKERKYSGCGSIGVSNLDYEVGARDGDQVATVTRARIQEFSLVQDGQDDRAGIARLERRVAGQFSAGALRARLQSAAAAGPGDAYTLGALRRKSAEAPYCRDGVLTDPRSQGERP